MATVHLFEKEKLKPVVNLFLGTGANYEDKFPTQFKRPMRLVVSENIPSLRVCDGFHWVDALFTKDSINDFRKNWSHLKFSQLRDKLIYVQRWSLRLRQRDSSKQLCTYNNLTVVYCIEQFKPIVHEIPSQRQTLSAKNLFDDPKIRTMLEGTRHDFLQNLIETKHESIRELDDSLGVGQSQMPSLKGLFGDNDATAVTD